MNDFAYTFPPTKWAAARTSIEDQSRCIREEAREADDAVWDHLVGHKPLAYVAVETLDIIQACETMLRILERDYGIDVGEAVRAVYKKNDARGYYDVQGAKETM